MRQFSRVLIFGGVMFLSACGVARAASVTCPAGLPMQSTDRMLSEPQSAQAFKA